MNKQIKESLVKLYQMHYSSKVFDLHKSEML
jgi:hypothetical protein